MLSPDVLADLRIAATLTHALPGLRTRIHAGPDLLVDAGATPAPEVTGSDPAAATCLTACEFRQAVARAHRRSQDGTRLTLRGLHSGTSPRVELVVPDLDGARVGGLYRVALGDRWVWAFATTLDAAIAYESGLDLVEHLIPGAEILNLGIRPDSATEVSLAYAETAALPGSSGEARVISLESLLARWSAEELLLDLMEGVGHPSRP